MRLIQVLKTTFVVLNVKLPVKPRFKILHCLLKLLYTAFAFNTTMNTACFFKIFAYTSKKHDSVKPCIALNC